jgi:type IV pilus assembly protein PilM
MPSSNVCWGIEIGAGGIKALKLEAAGENVRVSDFVVVPHKKVLSTPGIDPSEVVRVSLGELVNQVDLTGTAVAMSVPGHSAFARFAKLPPVEPKKVPDIVKFEAVQQIPFPIDQVEWDYQTFKAPDSPDVEVGIFAITRDRIMERLALYEDVGIVPDYVTLSPVAAYNAMAYDLAFTEKTPGTIILDIGTTSTDLIIAESGRVWIRTFPIGGHHFTEALVNAFQLSYPKAEKLKREAESSKHARHIFQAMRPIFGDLAQDVQRSIGYYQSLHRDAKLERLVGLGSTFRLPGLRKYLKQQVGMDVFRMEQFKRLSVDGPRAGEFQAQTLGLATAYGLGLQGLGMATLEANLMPVHVIRNAMWRRKTKWFGIAAGIAVAAGAAMFIRPFLDDTEASSNPLPRDVSEVISKGNSLKGEASEATNPSFENTAAGQILNLAENREVYAMLADDLGQLVAFANSKVSVKSGPALVVTVFDTAFQPGGVGMDDGGMGGEPQPGGDPATAGQPRIMVSLTGTTTAEDPRMFAINAIDGWLRQNQERPGRPYKIIPRGSTRLAGTTEAAGAPAGPGLGGMDVLGDSPMSMGAPISDGGVMPGGRGAAPGGRGGGAPPAFAPPPMFESSPGPAMQPPGMSSAPSHEPVRQLAPLPPAPAPEEGTRTTTLNVSWEIVMLPKTPAQTDGGDH